MGLIGQTAEIAPADKKIYALRDATSTVENIGLICASIMSKKLAEGIDALVLDVKTGSGAFMAKEEDAMHLAEVMVDTARRMGKKAVALITDMEQPLGRMAGHSNEVIESIDVLKGHGPSDLRELSLELSAWMFYLGERTKSVEEGRALAEEMIASGKALENFRQGIRCKAAMRASLTILPFCPGRNREVIVSQKAGYIRDPIAGNSASRWPCWKAAAARKKIASTMASGWNSTSALATRLRREKNWSQSNTIRKTKLAEAREMIASSFVIGDTVPASRILIRRILGGS